MRTIALDSRLTVPRLTLCAFCLFALVARLIASESGPANELDSQRLFYSPSERTAMNTSVEKSPETLSKIDNDVRAQPVKPVLSTQLVRAINPKLPEPPKVVLHYNAFVANNHTVQVIINSLPCKAVRVPITRRESAPITLQCPQRALQSFQIKLLWPTSVLSVQVGAKSPSRLDVGQGL